MKDKNNWNKLNPDEAYIIENKGTERPFTGAYNVFYKEGVYSCKRCDLQLYESKSKFNSECGWPSFDAQLAQNVEHVLDKDGRRTEIVCSNCKGHLGHVFFGEGFTDKNTRHCVNSLSLNFSPDYLEEQ